MGGVGGSLFTGEAVLGVFGEDRLRALNRRPILPPRPLDALLNESTCAGGRPSMLMLCQNYAVELASGCAKDLSGSASEKQQQLLPS